MNKVKSYQLLFLVAVVILLLYFSNGIYSLQSGQHAVILRFGKVVNVVSESGIHYQLPFPVEKAIKVHISEVQTITIQEHKEQDVEKFTDEEIVNDNEDFEDDDFLEEDKDFLYDETTVYDESTAGDEYFTGDENMILVRIVVSYDIKNLADYLFNNQNVKSTIQTVGQKCLSNELAIMSVDDVMTTGKSFLRLIIKERIQNLLDVLETGVRIISVELTDISPPTDVSTAFKAVSDARVKKQEIIRQAEGFANSVIPKARGNAGSAISKAEAYAREATNRANGSVKAFNDLLAEYKRNPEITTKLKYLETMQKIYSNSQVSIDANPAQSTYYIYQRGDN